MTSFPLVLDKFTINLFYTYQCTFSSAGPTSNKQPAANMKTFIFYVHIISPPSISHAHSLSVDIKSHLVTDTMETFSEIGNDPCKFLLLVGMHLCQLPHGRQHRRKNRTPFLKLVNVLKVSLENQQESTHTCIVHPSDRRPTYITNTMNTLH